MKRKTYLMKEYKGSTDSYLISKKSFKQTRFKSVEKIITSNGKFVIGYLC